jgi:hypothetical protein
LKTLKRREKELVLAREKNANEKSDLTEVIGADTF